MHSWSSQKVFILLVFVIQIISWLQYKRYGSQNDLVYISVAGYFEIVTVRYVYVAPLKVLNRL